MKIFDDESLEDLQIDGLKLIQKKNGFRFGADAVFLVDFVKDIPSKITLDFCTGSAVIPILLSAKSSAEKIYGLEIQKPFCEMAVRSVEMNNLSGKIIITEGDVKNASEIYGKRQFDLITCNPPYMPVGCGIQNPNDSKYAARHEILCTLNDVIGSAAPLLKHKGHLALIHKPARLADIICLMRKYDIEPKRIRFIHKNQSSEPSLVLADGIYKGGNELRILPPLYLYDSDGSETEALKEVYGK